MVQPQVIQRAMSAKSTGTRGLLTSYQRNIVESQGNKNIQMNYQHTEDIYGIGQSMKVQQAQLMQR